MNVKRTIAIILILSIIVVAVFALSGCNITNDGSEDELKGIYGVTTTYYKSYEGKKYNVSGQYEYFLLPNLKQYRLPDLQSYLLLLLLLVLIHI